MQWYVNINRWGIVREWYGAFTDWGPLAEDSVIKLKGCPLNVCTVYAYTMYGVFFSPLWLKSEPGRPAISVSTSQQVRVGQIVWFGCLSAISQLTSREGEGGGVWQLCLHSVTQPYTIWPRWREQGVGLRSLPLVSCASEENMIVCMDRSIFRVRIRHFFDESARIGKEIFLFLLISLRCQNVPYL
jgi:hypothetical protein